MTLSAVRPTIASRLRAITKGLLITIVAFVLFNLFFFQYRQVEKEMVWRCKAPEESFTPGSPPFGRPALELWFKDTPGSRELMTGPTAEKLCQELPKSNKKTLRVQFEVSGSDFWGTRGHRMEAIDGQKYLYQSGDDGISGGTGPDPFTSTFRRYFWKTK